MRPFSARKLKERLQQIGPILSRLRSISFSFYAEDLLIYHLQPQQTGFYVDVGAFHPRDLSNTFKLYLKGWRGITIEPNPDAAAAFQSFRPRGRHLTMRIAAEAATLSYLPLRGCSAEYVRSGAAVGGARPADRPDRGALQTVDHGI